jgi:hypothetical protein
MVKIIEAIVDESVNNITATNDAENDVAIRDAIVYRKAGGSFLSADEFKARMRAAIEEYTGVSV